MRIMHIKSLYKSISITVIFTGLISCGGGSSDTPKPDPVPDPVAAVLELPANNAVCFDGTVISSAMSEVNFSWQPAEHTDRYEVEVTNLNTDVKSTYPTNTNSVSVSLERGTPYSWQVTSLASNTQAEANSASWKFYLAGEGITTYAPFPAELLSPASGNTVSPTEVNFDWKGSDPDSQELSYTLYVDTTDGKTLVQAEAISENSFTIQNLEASTVYYWRVVTTDPEGNSAASPVVSFRTN